MNKRACALAFVLLFSIACFAISATIAGLILMGVPTGVEMVPVNWIPI